MRKNRDPLRKLLGWFNQFARNCECMPILGPDLAAEPDLTRLVRTLLRALKAQALENVSLTGAHRLR